MSVSVGRSRKEIFLRVTLATANRVMIQLEGKRTNRKKINRMIPKFYIV